MNSFLEIKVPVENVNDLTAKLLVWKIASGATVKPGDVLAELETTKATFEVTATGAGVVEYTWAIGSEVPVGETLCRIHGEGFAKPAEPPAEPPARPTPPVAPKAESAPASTTTKPVTAAASLPGAHAARTVFSERAQALLAEFNLEASAFDGLGFVKEFDVRQKLADLGKGPRPVAPPVVKPDSVPAPAARTEPVRLPDEEGERVPLERAKLYENRELLAADRAVLKSTIFHLCPAAGLQEACARQTPPLQRFVVILHETAQLLKKFRQLNACLVEDSMFLYRHIHLGFAVDMGRGLKVLVIRHAESLGFAGLAARLDELLVRYTTNTLQIADVTGSTFTITDLAQDGVFTFDPVINKNQAAILGIGADLSSASGALGFMLSCAFDHRLLAGRQVAEFLRDLGTRLAAHAQSLRDRTPVAGPCCSRCLQTAEDLRKFGHMLIPSVEPAGHVCSICFSGF